MDFFASVGMSQSIADFEAASRSPASVAPPVPKRPSSPISKGASRARDANKHSFLDLPGEIRNEIYALLLVFPAPLHSAGALYPQLCRRGRDRNRDLRMAWAQPSWNDALRQDLLQHAYLQSGALFSSCRQVYHEAMSTFLGKNMFTIAKHHSHWALGETTVEVHGRTGQFISGGIKWLRQLGSQIGMLSKVTINLDALCPTDCSADGNGSNELRFEHAAYIEIFPLLSFLSSVEYAPNVEFIQPKDSAHRQSNRDHGLSASNVSNDIDITAMNKGLRALKRDDLHLRTYKTLLGRIGLHRSGTKGFVHYLKAGPSSEPDEDYSNAGITQTQTHRAKPTLFNIPKEIKSSIFRHILVQGSRAALDLDCEDPNAFSKKWNLAFSQVNRESSKLLDQFWCNNEFVLNLTSVDVRTSFSGYRALYWWLKSSSNSSTSPGRIYPYAINNQRRHNVLRRCKISLKIRLDVAASTSDVRISIMDLIRVTTHVDAYESMDIIVRVTLIECLPNGEENISIKEDMSLWDLRTAAWKAIRYIPRNCSDINSPCPEVFVNPSGRLIEYCLAGTVQLIFFPKRMSERTVSPGEEKPYNGSTGCYLRYLTMQGTWATAKESAKSAFWLADGGV